MIRGEELISAHASVLFCVVPNGTLIFVWYMYPGLKSGATIISSLRDFAQVRRQK